MFNLNIIVIVLLIPSFYCLTVGDFKPKFLSSSKPSGFYNVDTGSPSEGQILSFVDLNGDKQQGLYSYSTDYIAIKDRTSTQLSFFYWNIEQQIFSQTNLTMTSTTGTLQQLMACDINADGKHELVITYKQNNSYHSQIYQTNCNPSCSISIWNIDYALLTGMEAVPFIFDRYSNGSIAIFTFKNSQRVIVSAYTSQKILFSYPYNNMIVNPPSTLSPISSHFASMIDLNGDCFSDIIFVSGPQNNKFQIHIKNNHNSYDYSQMTINKNISWMSFADFDSNGSPDIFLIIYQNNGYVPYTILNIHKPQEICQNYGIGYNVTNMIEMILPSGYAMVQDSNVKIGDFNFDGFPDLLGIYSVDGFRKVSILKNKGNLVFQVFDADLAPLQQITNPIQTCLYDFGENGLLGVIVISQTTRANNALGTTRISIINNLIQDTLFIKLLPLLPSSSDDFQSTALVGGIGVTIQWRLTNLDGDKTISTSNQHFQWNYGTLMLPFSSKGLGRTNNYIQDLNVGYSGFGMKNEWTPVIPNSQLVVLPRNDADWKLQTLLKDSSRVYYMIYIAILCLLLMGILIMFLNWRQNQEDKRDHYNFIQMIR